MELNIDKLKKENTRLIENKELFPNGIMFLGLGGSYAYDTYKRTVEEGEEPSDIDLRGIAFNTKENILSLREFERSQYVDDLSDTTIYFFNKYANLLYSSNPSILETINLPDSKIVIDSPEAKLLRENSDIFLSKKTFYTFGRYAEDQLQRLQNALARDAMSQSEKEKHILKSVKRQLEDTMSKCSKQLNIGEEIKLYIDKSSKEDYETEIFIDANFKRYPLRDYTSILNSMLMSVKQYGKLNKRNKKKSIEKLDKHCMHLIRIIKMCTEILSGKGVITSRVEAGDIDLLMDIRNGKFTYDEMFLLCDDLLKEMVYAYNNSLLPERIDDYKFNEIIMTVNEMTLNRIKETL